MSVDVFIGRKRELKSLNELAKKKSASLVVIRGRRRIGKSRLIQEFGKSKIFFHFSGIPAEEKTTAQDQRDIFSLQLGKKLALQGISSHDWSTLFSLLAKEAAKGEVVILLDEISWMGSKDPHFLGKLKNAWDLEFKNNPKLILILCGSVSTWIEKNIISSTAFFGRISLFLKLEELPLEESYEFLRRCGFCGGQYEAFKLLSVMGGIPWYLEQVKGGGSADEIIKGLCFKKEGILFNDFESIFHDLFEKRSHIYRPIVEMLASGPLDFGGLCQSLNYSKSGTLSQYLDDLITSGFLTRDHTWSIKSGEESKLSKYRLSDNYLRFYLKYIYPNRNKINRESFKEISLTALPGWTSIMGYQFENLVLKNRFKIWELLGIRPEDIISDNPYFQRATKGKKGCQIDYLIQTRYHTLFACEIKFSLHPVSSKVVSDVKKKIESLPLPKRFSCWPVLIHVNGVSDLIRDVGFFSEIIDFSQFLNLSR
jgi:AAA+ ATPase superfamily predicted ATPase